LSMPTSWPGVMMRDWFSPLNENGCFRCFRCDPTENTKENVKHLPPPQGVSGVSKNTPNTTETPLVVNKKPNDIEHKTPQTPQTPQNNEGQTFPAGIIERMAECPHLAPCLVRRGWWVYRGQACAVCDRRAGCPSWAGLDFEPSMAVPENIPAMKSQDLQGTSRKPANNFGTNTRARGRPMLIVTDTREQAPLDFSPYPCTVEPGTLSRLLCEGAGASGGRGAQERP